MPRLLATILLATVLCAGAETRIRVSGVPGKSEQQVLALMGGRLYQIRANPASPSRADDAAFLLRQLLQKDGYADVQVTWKIVNSGEILLTVGQGTRLALGKVTVLGAPGNEATRLARLYRGPAEKDRMQGSTPPFREEDVATGLSYLTQDYQAHGYWAAVAGIEKRETERTSGAVNLLIRVTPGPLHHLARAKVSSQDERGGKLVATTAEPFIGRPATTANLNSMRSTVEEAFLSRGYPDAKISMGRSLASPAFIPEFTVDLGTRVRLRHVTADGFVRTNPKRIERRMQDLEGNWYDKAAMNKRLRELLATGAFTSARGEATTVGDNLIDATLHFEEANAREITLAAGAGSYQGPIGRFTYADRNLGGELLGFSTGFEVSARGVLGETRLSDPWLFGSDYAATARIYALSYAHEGYDSFESGLDGALSRKFGDHYHLELLAGWSVINNSEHGLPRSALGETVYSHPRLRLTQTLDYRDNPILPKSGWHLEAPLQIGATLGGDSTAYFKTGLIGAWYHQLNSNYQLACGGQFGMLIPTGDDTEFPIDLRYFNGGARSVRSFPERELGPTAGPDHYATGGNAYWATNAEIIRNLGGPVKLVGFFDAGTLSQKFSDLARADVELAVGLGLRLDLPIGPVRLEYGYNLTRDPGEPTGAFHFAIGAAF
ncbi:MAG: BamA/TamA family outer membrane protein [Verrucomicrobia bacterium]|nr:BamA/TamA family outer membrane protein [Verrucomicrobiota bacterium]